MDPLPHHRQIGRAPQRRVAAALALILALLIAPTAGFAQTKPRPKLDEILSAVVRVAATAPADARTARSLGRRRLGNGVVIDASGLILTIGYLILEADEVRVKARGGAPMPAKVVAYDHETGLGLIRATGKLGVKPIALGDSRAIKARDTLVIAGFGGQAAARPVAVVSRRDFAGYWEYLLEGALFTAPLYRNFGGAAVIDLNGRLVGIGSLAIGDAAGPRRPSPGNMVVPIEKLKPILADLLAHGRSRGPRRPWIGAFAREIVPGRVAIVLVSPGGPAARAGLRPGSFVVAVAGRKVGGLIDFYRKLWAAGRPGSKIAITVLEGGATRTVTITAGDRYRWLKLGKRG